LYPEAHIKDHLFYALLAGDAARAQWSIQRG